MPSSVAVRQRCQPSSRRPLGGSQSKVFLRVGSPKWAWRDRSSMMSQGLKLMQRTASVSSKRNRNKFTTKQEKRSPAHFAPHRSSARYRCPGSPSSQGAVPWWVPTKSAPEVTSDIDEPGRCRRRCSASIGLIFIKGPRITLSLDTCTALSSGTWQQTQPIHALALHQPAFPKSTDFRQ